MLNPSLFAPFGSLRSSYRLAPNGVAICGVGGNATSGTLLGAISKLPLCPSSAPLLGGLAAAGVASLGLEGLMAIVSRRKFSGLGEAMLLGEAPLARSPRGDGGGRGAAVAVGSVAGGVATTGATVGGVGGGRGLLGTGATTS